MSLKASKATKQCGSRMKSLCILAACLLIVTAQDIQSDQVIVTYGQPNDTLSLNLTAIIPSVSVPGTTLVGNITEHGIRLDIFAITHCTNIDPQIEWEIVCAQFEEDPTVVSCERDDEVTLDAVSKTPDDPLYPQQWSLQAIDVATVWGKGVFGSPAIRVCMVDTGLDIAASPSDVTQNLLNGTGAAYSNGVASSNVQDLNGEPRCFFAIQNSCHLQKWMLSRRSRHLH